MRKQLMGMAFSLAFGMTTGATAQAQTPPNGFYDDWVQYAQSQTPARTYFYSPKSIYRIGDLRQVEVTDSDIADGAKTVLIIHIDCAGARTLQVRTAKVYNAVTNVYIRAEDLSSTNVADHQPSGSVGEALQNKVC
jgi:hypothetical protein